MSAPLETNTGSYFSSGSNGLKAVIATRTFGVAVIAGGAGVFGLGMSPQQGVEFAALVGLGASIGDAADNAMNWESTIGEYNKSGKDYINLTDAVSGGLVCAGLFYYLDGGMGGDFYSKVGIAAVASGAGAKLAKYTTSMSAGASVSAAVAE